MKVFLESKKSIERQQKFTSFKGNLSNLSLVKTGFIQSGAPQCLLHFKTRAPACRGNEP